MTILYTKQNENNWKTISEEDLQSKGISYGLPIRWKQQLQRGYVIYTDDYMYRLESTPIPSSDEPADFNETIFVSGLQSDNWVEKDEMSLEKTLLMMGGYATNWKQRLLDGETVKFPLGRMRLADTLDCPICGFSFRESWGSLSRRDNQTLICSCCGDNEAFIDLAYERMTPILLFGQPFAHVHSILEQKFTSTLSMPIEDMIIHWANKDFSITLTPTYSFHDFTSRLQDEGYETTNEWVKEKMREELVKTIHANKG